MNETFKVILYLVIGWVIGIVSYILVRWLTNRANKNRMGTDSNVIKQVNNGIKDVEQTIESVSSRIETAAGKATEAADTSRALTDLIRRVEERQQGFKQ